MTDALLLRRLAEKYNDPQYFRQDPIAFPRRFAELYRRGEADLRDVEISGVVAAHLAWGRRAMIVRDTARALEQMQWKPYDYIMRGSYRSDSQSLHRTVKWSEFAGICSRLREYYLRSDSLERLSVEQLRTEIFGSKPDPRAANKKINMLRRWFVRRDGLVDLGIWTATDPAELIIPLDVHVYQSAVELGLTSRKAKDLSTALEITSVFSGIFPGDPCKGDFALFGYGIDK